MLPLKSINGVDLENKSIGNMCSYRENSFLDLFEFKIQIQKYLTIHDRLIYAKNKLLIGKLSFYMVM